LVRWIREILRYHRICDVTSVLFMIGLFAVFLAGFRYLVPRYFDSNNWSFIGLTLILINVTVWQTWRSSSDLLILPFVLKGKKDNRSIEYVTKTQNDIWSGWRLLGLERSQFLESYENFELYFDIGNKGSQDSTVHEYRVHLDYPRAQARRDFIDPQPIFDTETIAVFSVIEQKYRVEPTRIHMERRKTLRPGERMTFSFPLSLRDDQLYVFGIELYTTRRERTRWWMIYKRRTHVYCCDVAWKNGINCESLNAKLRQKVTS